MATLVLKGHSTRGVEVIQLLVMLSAKSQYTGTFKGFYYWIEDGQVISSDIPPENSMIFSLEEFLEKYPYKVGDKVKAWVNGYRGVFNIQDITWDSITKEIKYRIHDYWHSVENLQPYKEVIMEKNQPPKTQVDVDKYLQEHSVKNAMNVVDIETCLETDGLKLPENVVINSKGIGSIQFIQWYEKSKYPRDFDECCEVLNLGEDGKLWTKGYKSSLVQSIHQLIICRDAYWKIAGEEMGLDKPWEPDWNNVSDKHCIYFVSGEIWLTECQTRQCTLAFLTKEMRDAFYNNFKDLIEKCKELL